jgi:hypothetical protein
MYINTCFKLKNSYFFDKYFERCFYLKCKYTNVLYSDKQNRVLLVIVFIQKAIAYTCVNKIQICKHESCSIQHIEPCEKKINSKSINVW